MVALGEGHKMLPVGGTKSTLKVMLSTPTVARIVYIAPDPLPSPAVALSMLRALKVMTWLASVGQLMSVVYVQRLPAPCQAVDRTDRR